MFTNFYKEVKNKWKPAFYLWNYTYRYVTVTYKAAVKM